MVKFVTLLVYVECVLFAVDQVVIFLDFSGFSSFGVTGV